MTLYTLRKHLYAQDVPKERCLLPLFLHPNHALCDKGIRILQSIPHTPQQNGHAERFNHTLMDKAQSIQLEACFPQSWWEFAVEHAVHLYNRTPIQCVMVPRDRGSK
jgi:hypothetical protein